MQDVQALYPHGISAVMSFHSDMEGGPISGVKQELQGTSIKVSNTEGHDSKGNSKAERTNRKARESQRALILGAVGRRKPVSYTHLRAHET